MSEKQNSITYSYSLRPGLYALRSVGGSQAGWFAVVALASAGGSGGGATFLGRDDPSVTLMRAKDGPVVAHVDRTPANLYVTEYGLAGAIAADRGLAVKLLDLEAGGVVQATVVAAAPEPVKPLQVQASGGIGVSISAHSEGVGESVFPSGQWAGQYGTDVKLDGFTLSLAGGVEGLSVEYRVGNAQLGLTNWVKAGKYCGTRGKGLALTMFAAKLSGPRAAEFEISYRGNFIGQGDSPPARNGELCQSAGNQPLAAIFVEIIPAKAAEEQRTSKRALIPDSFDEQEYLLRNPDVATAVALGEIPSGYHHFMTHGKAEGREEPRRRKNA